MSWLLSAALTFCLLSSVPHLFNIICKEEPEQTTEHRAQSVEYQYTHIHTHKHTPSVVGTFVIQLSQSILITVQTESAWTR